MLFQVQVKSVFLRLGQVNTG